MQNVVLGQDTPLRSLPVKPAALGVGTTVHVDPFHCSASVLSSFPPTAMHSVALAQLTEFRKTDPLSAGVVTMVHAEPFHCSTSAMYTSFTTWSPTPTQNVALAQETPERVP